MMTEKVPVLTSIKELLDDDAALRRRFRACARTRRSTSPQEVEHWRGVLRAESEAGEGVSAREVEAALGELTMALMPNSPAAEGLVGGVPTGGAASADVAEAGVPVVPPADSVATGKGVPVAEALYDEVSKSEEHGELPEPEEDGRPVEIEAAKDLVSSLIVRCAHDWGGYFENLCRHPESLRVAGGREFHWKSKGLGWSFSREEIEDALFDVAHVLYPGSPAGQPHAYYDELHTAATMHLDEHELRDALNAEEEAVYVERAITAMKARDWRGYRRALREWIAAGSARADGGP